MSITKYRKNVSINGIENIQSRCFKSIVESSPRFNGVISSSTKIGGLTKKIKAAF